MRIFCLPYNKGESDEARVDKAPKEVLKHLENYFSTEDGDDFEITVKNTHIANWDKEKILDFFYSELKENEKTVFIGGDQTISYFSLKEFYSVFEKENKGIVWLDAQPDLADLEVLNNESVLRYLINKEINGNDVFLIGIRDYDSDEYDFVKRNIPNHYRMRDIQREGFKTIIKKLEEFLSSKDVVYVSLDMDVVDPVFSPGVKRRIPGGFTSREIIEIINILGKHATFMDLTEILVDRDKEELTTTLAAKLIVEFI